MTITNLHELHHVVPEVILHDGESYRSRESELSVKICDANCLVQDSMKDIACFSGKLLQSSMWVSRHGLQAAETTKHHRLASLWIHSSARSANLPSDH